MPEPPASALEPVAGAAPASAPATFPAPAPGAARVYPSVWVDRVEVRAAGDRDGDGYHSRLVVRVDVDAELGWAEVFAGIDLVDAHGRVAVAYDTDAFAVQGRVSRDAVDVEFELLDDFPSDVYGLYVTVRDARSGDVLDGVGPHEFAGLAHLRLEGARRDGHGHGHAIGYGVGFSTGYHAGPRDDGYGSFAAVSYAAGADPLWLAALALGAIGARARRRGREGRRAGARR